MRFATIAATALLFAPVALAGPHEDALMAADRAFNELAQKDGVAAAFEAYAAPDARMFRGEERPVSGPAEIRAMMAADYAAGGSLTWAPVEAVASDDGTAGYTHGRWTYVSPPDGAGKIHTGTGSYVSVWRRQPDGSLKFVADIGTPDRPKEKAD